MVGYFFLGPFAGREDGEEVSFAGVSGDEAHDGECGGLERRREGGGECVDGGAGDSERVRLGEELQREGSSIGRRGAGHAAEDGGAGDRDGR